MSPFLVALMMSAGASAWVYTKVMRRTGGNTQNAAVVTAIAGVMTFIITATLLKAIDSMLAN